MSSHQNTQDVFSSDNNLPSIRALSDVSRNSYVYDDEQNENDQYFKTGYYKARN